MIVLDASVLIAFLEASDAHHERSVQLLHDALDEELLIHPLTLAEVLVGPARSHQAARMMDELLAAGISVASLGAPQAVRLAELRATTRLKMPDCCVLAAALESMAAVATFDDALAAAARAAHLEVLDAAPPR